MPAEPHWRVDPRQWWLLGATVLAVSLPHLLRMPWSLATVWALLAGARLLLGIQGLSRMPSWVKLPLLLLTGVLVLHHYGKLASRDAAVTLLVMMAAMKLLELTRQRDAYILVFTGFFLLSTAFLDDPGLAMALYLFPAFLLLMMTWLSLQQRPGTCHCRGLARDAVRHSLQALPVALALFLLLPRLPAPLWELPDRERTATTGLSERMEPGQVSALALSPEPVAYVRFAGAIPPPWQRYFRGPVFEVTDGRRWDVAPYRKLEDGGAVSPLSPNGPGRIDYELLLEPQPGSRYLPVLEYPASLPAHARLQGDLTLRPTLPLDRLRRYRLSAMTTRPPGRLTPTERIYNLIVPEGLSKRVRELARGLRTQHPKPKALIEAALAFFHREPFVYTLHPPALDEVADPVDAFLFETRRGFCEHFASAFTLLMRAAGLPARVVTGYLGGEVNETGGFLVLRKADAHAWSEVWIDGVGWWRVDPTAAVAPERIQYPVDPQASRYSDTVRYLLAGHGGRLRWWRRLREGWQTLDATWQQALLRLDSERHGPLLGALGLEHSGHRLLVFLALFLAVPLAGAARVLLRWRRQSDASNPAHALYQRFQRLCRRGGIEATEQVGPCALLARIREQRPEWLPEAERFLGNYVRLRYARTPETARPALLAGMRRSLRALRR